MPKRRTRSPYEFNADRLENVFHFLKENSKYNRSIQNKTYRDWLSPYRGTADRLKSLMFNVVNTQSRAKLDLLSKCWKGLHAGRAGANALESVGQLADYLANVLLETRCRREPEHFEDLWTVLKSVPGWGQKTSALFVKSVVRIHMDRNNEDLRFLSNFQMKASVRPYVPVDNVIIHIFNKHLRTGGQELGFGGINALLRKQHTSAKDLLLWDDLWFWGFITQESRNEIRRTALNMAKFWSIHHAPGDLEREVTRHAKQFIKILRS